MSPYFLCVLGVLFALHPASALAWCISKDVCSVAGLCDYVTEGKITYLNVPVFLLIIYTIPLLFLLYHLWWKIITKFKKALTGTLAFERQLLPIYIRWLQLLMVFMTWLVISLFLAPIHPILAVILAGIELFGLSLFCNTLVVWLHLPDLSRRSLLIAIGTGVCVATAVTSTWYFVSNPGKDWTSLEPNWSYFGIVYNGAWCVIYFALLVVPYVPFLRRFSGRSALYRFLLVLTASWLLSTFAAVLTYYDIDGASCVTLAQNALASLFLVFIYVSSLSADSIEWRKKGYAGTKGSSTSSARLPLLTLTDDWRIDYEELEVAELLARGNFAEVHRGYWRGINVAIKTLYQTQMKGTELKQFENEVELLRQLHHPNIVLFIGACMQAPHFSIVMEFMPQGSLYHVIHSGRELSLHRKCLMGRDIARGMLYLHSHKPPLVHRDLKSLNILVDDSLNLKVTDFGLSCKGNHTVTTVGTPVYSAPEVLRSSSFSEKSDVYSYGIILWELLTREEPYEGVTVFEIINRVVSDKLRPTLPQPSADHPTALLDLIQGCWHEEPEARPDFGEILEFIELQVEETRDPESLLASSHSIYVDLNYSSGARRTRTAGIRRSSSSLLAAAAAAAAASSMPLPATSVKAKPNPTKDGDDEDDDEHRRRTTTGSGEESGDGSVRLLLDHPPASWSSDVDRSREQSRDDTADDRHRLVPQQEPQQQQQQQQQIQPQRQSEGGGESEDEGEDSRQRQRRLTINDCDP